jgi:DNA polymerase-1
LDYYYVEQDISPVVSKFADKSVFALDLETTGLNPIDSRILLCQIGFDDSVYVINVGSVNLAPILPFITSHKWLKLIHNTKFESRFFLWHYEAKIANSFDTYLAEQLLSTDGRQSNSLAAVAKKYAGVTLDKSIRETFIKMSVEAFTEEQLKYAAGDVEVLFPIWQAQSKLLKERKMERVAEVEFNLAPIVADMENEGVPLDVKKWRDKLSKYGEDHEESRLKMNSLLFDNTGIPEQMGMFVRDGLNLNSPKQIKEAFHKLGIDLDSTDEREIALVDHPAAKELLHYREIQKIMSSYGGTFLDKVHPFTSRIHADFKQIGTATGRFACREPNLQQMPEEFRECVTLDEWVIIAADYSQIELRILAELSQDPVFIGAFNTGHDLHKSTASIMFNMPIEDVTKEQRFMAKTLNFGITYGMGVYKLMDMLNGEFKISGQKQLTKFQVQQILDRYKSTYKKASAWLLLTGQKAYTRLYSETMLGRRRYFNLPSTGENMEKEIASIRRQGANSPIQGTNADITKMAMVNLYDDLVMYKFRAKMVIQVHDEIVVLAHKHQAESVKEVVVDSMMRSAQELITSVPVKVDAYISDIWKKG